MGRTFSPEVTTEVREVFAPIMREQSRAIIASAQLAAMIASGAPCATMQQALDLVEKAVAAADSLLYVLAREGDDAR